MANPRDLIAAVAGSQEAPPQAQAQPQAPVPPANKPAGSPPQQTAEGKAQEVGKAKNEGDNQAAPPFVELTMPDGSTRKMTQEAILGMTSRYAALNHRNAQMKPVTDVIENYMRSNPNLTPAQLAQTLANLAAGNDPNVQFGAQGGINQNQGGQQPQQRSTPPSNDDFTKWESDNASALPPGYRDMHGNMAGMMQMMQQQQAMIQQLLAGAGGQVEAARQAQMGAMQSQNQSIQQTIATNLDRAQQQLQLPTESANDFMTFATERGYGMEDFADPGMTMKIMQDFANTRNSPEMDRLRGIHQRRQAFTPGTGQAPGGAGGGAPSPDQAEFAAFADRQMNGRL